VAIVPLGKSVEERGQLGRKQKDLGDEISCKLKLEEGKYRTYRVSGQSPAKLAAKNGIGE